MTTYVVSLAIGRKHLLVRDGGQAGQSLVMAEFDSWSDAEIYVRSKVLQGVPPDNLYIRITSTPDRQTMVRLEGRGNV